MKITCDKKARKNIEPSHALSAAFADTLGKSVRTRNGWFDPEPPHKAIKP